MSDQGDLVAGPPFMGLEKAVEAGFHAGVEHTFLVVDRRLVGRLLGRATVLDSTDRTDEEE